MRHSRSTPQARGTVVLVGMEDGHQRPLQQAFDRKGWVYQTAKSTFGAAYAVMECDHDQQVGVIMDIDRLGMKSCTDIAKSIGKHKSLYRALLIGIRRGNTGVSIDKSVFDRVYDLPVDADLCATHMELLQPDNMWDFPLREGENDTN